MNTYIEPGDRFIDPIDGEIREVLSVGNYCIGADNYPYDDTSIFTTDGGCIAAEDISRVYLPGEVIA